MSTLSIDAFKAKMQGGGARSNLFRVIVNFPVFAGGDSELASFMVKGAQLPSAEISPIIVPFRGRQLQVAGDRIFPPISLTVINDTNFKVRNAFERWSNGINTLQSNGGRTNPNDYMSDMIIQQIDRGNDGRVLKEYTIRSAFPINVSPIDLSFDSENQIEEFTVELQYLYWTSGGIST